MPFYEFKCPDCGKKIDVMLKVSERDTPQECPECSTKMTKLISPVGIPRKLDPLRQDFETKSKNELADALKENDKHRKDEERRVEQEIKSGEFISS